MVADPAIARLALVNNAANVALHGQVDQLDPAAMMRAYAVNTVAPVLLMGWILRNGAPGVPIRIVNVSTGAAVQPLPGLGAYSATKAALRLVGMILAAELEMRPGAPRDVSVLSYDPGVVETPMQQAVRASTAEKLPIVQMFQQLAAHRMLRTPDVPATAIADYLDANGHPRFREETFAFEPPPATAAGLDRRSAFCTRSASRNDRRITGDIDGSGTSSRGDEAVSRQCLSDCLRCPAVPPCCQSVVARALPLRSPRMVVAGQLTYVQLSRCGSIARRLRPHFMVERRDLQLVSWELDDGEQLHREAPTTFWIPSEAQRTSLSVGDIVKLIFRMTVRDHATGEVQVEVERMWVIVSARDGDRYREITDNDPVLHEMIVSGATIVFDPPHVIQIFDDGA